MAGKIILVFESDDHYVDMLQSMYKSNFDVKVCTDPNEGIEFAASNAIAMVYLSVELPRTNGFTVCRKLRKRGETADIPIVIVSSEATEDTFEKHKKLKDAADAYLLKPFDAPALEAVCSHHVGDAASSDVVLEDPGDGADEMDDFGEVEELDGLESLAIEDDEVAIEDDEVAIEDDEVAIEDDEVAIEDDEVAIEDDEVAIEDDEVAIEDDEVAIEDDEVAIEDDEVAIEGDTTAVAQDDEPVGGVQNDDASIDANQDTTDDGDVFSEWQQERKALEDKVTSLESELAAARAAGGSGKGGDARENLELRQLLNKKDRELLDEKDRANNKEKQLLEKNDRVIELERLTADLKDKQIQFETDKHDLLETIDNLNTDKDVLSKKSADQQGRIDSFKDRIEKLESEIDKINALRSEDATRLKEEMAAALADMEEQKDEDKARALEELAADMDGRQRDALTAQETELQAEAAKKLESELTEQRIRYDAAAEEEREKLETARVEALDAQQQAHDAEMTALREQSERTLNEYTTKLSNAEEIHQTALGELSDTREALESAREELNSTQAELSAATEKMNGLTEEVQTLNGEVTEVQQRLSEATRARDASKNECDVLSKRLMAKNKRVAQLEAAVTCRDEALAANSEVVSGAREKLEEVGGMLMELSQVPPVEDAEEEEVENIVEDDADKDTLKNDEAIADIAPRGDAAGASDSDSEGEVLTVETSDDVVLEDDDDLSDIDDLEDFDEEEFK